MGIEMDEYITCVKTMVDFSPLPGIYSDFAILLDTIWTSVEEMALHVLP